MLRFDSYINNLKILFSDLIEFPIFVSWIIYTFAIYLFSLVIILNKNYHIIYHVPTDLYTYLITLIWFLSSMALSLFIITFNGMKQFSKNYLGLIIIFLLSSSSLLWGFIYPTKVSENTFSNTAVTTIFNKQEMKQRFVAGEASALDLSLLKSRTERNWDPIYIFYRTGCSYCHQSIPRLLNQLSEEQKHRIIFLDLDKSNNGKFAAEFGIYHAPTAVISTKGVGGYKNYNISKLVKVSGDSATIDNDTIKHVVSATTLTIR